MALRNLNALKLHCISRFENDFYSGDIVLPNSFKGAVAKVYDYSITYNKFTANIKNRSGQYIYLSNQWFYIATFFTPFYELLHEYKNICLKIFPKERFTSLKNGELSEEEKQNIINQGHEEDLELIQLFVTDYDWWGGGKYIDRNDFYVSPILKMPNLINASHEFVATLCAFFSENPQIAELLNEEIEKNKTKIKSPDLKDLSSYKQYITAIRTKPFILLAGISGTGKSRIVRELAYMSCPPIGKLQANATTPGNYCMIEVKPNWHDSSELLGYASGINNKYIVTPFIKFLVKAMRYPEVPFFVCLDEMNLAPVEQYFAEYLSILETRKENKDSITTGSLISPSIFKKYGDQLFKDLELEVEERDDLDNEFNQLKKIENELTLSGLCLPQNVIVVGTVNMDDTTHQFSRKVIDRAMTLEMNELIFENMFDEDHRLQYSEEPIDANYFIADSASANHALSFLEDEANPIKDFTINLMYHIDSMLSKTPFRVAYRFQNELVIYLRNLRLFDKEKPLDQLLANAVDEMLNMKVLPRIEGDEDLVEKPLKELEKWTNESGYIRSNAKIEEMLERLEHAHYTSYWP